MPNTIKRNKFIADYLQKQLLRLGLDNSLTLFYEYYLSADVSAKASIDIVNALIKDPILKPDIFDEDTVLFETLKCIGIMEVSKNKEEFEKLLKKREKIKDKKKEKTDFDKILGAMMKVPKPQKGEK